MDTPAGQIKWHAEGAYNPSDRGSNAGADHIVLEEPVHVGRLVRAKGDPLCKPAKKFWGLTGPDKSRVVTCHHCIRQALRLGMPIDAQAALDVGRSWSASLIIEKGCPAHVVLRSRWFRHPPPEPPTPPSDDRLLRVVQAIAPSVRAVRVTQMKPTGPADLEGTAVVE
jgi:hypothetical protein